jgi:hypothetical protein
MRVNARERIQRVSGRLRAAKKCERMERMVKCEGGRKGGDTGGTERWSRSQ